MKLTKAEQDMLGGKHGKATQKAMEILVALGNIYGGQLLDAMERDIPDWQAQVSTGNIQPTIQWHVDDRQLVPGWGMGGQGLERDRGFA